MRKAARFLISVVLILGLCFLFLNLKTNTYAQVSNPYSTPVNNPDVPQNLHTYSQNVMLEIMSAMICQLTGIDPIRKDHKCLGIDVENGKIGYVEGPKNGMAGGAIGSMSNLIGYTFQIPVHTGDYITYLASNFGITKQATAISTGEDDYLEDAYLKKTTEETTTGTGFEGLKPLLPVWTKFRDIVYVLFVLAFVIVGLGIMLRVKIDPRTVMTIQNQIPKIIIGIILITFSYAIAGFLIDIMWTLIYLLINLFASVDPEIQQSIAEYYNTQSSNVIKYAESSLGISRTAWDSSRGVGELLNAALDNTPGKAITYSLGAILGGSVGSGVGKLLSGLGAFGPIGAIASGLIGLTVGTVTAVSMAKAVAGIIAYLVILVAVFAALFRLWFKLVISFIYILIGVVLSPLWIITGIIPGSKLGFGSWIKYMLSNLIVFPITMAMFLIGKVFIDVFDNALKIGQQIFVPPLIGYGGELAPITALIGLGIILATPNVTKYAQEIFKSPKLDTAPIGQSIKSGIAPFAAGGKKAWGTLTRYPDTYRGIKIGALRETGRSLIDTGYRKIARRQMERPQGFTSSLINLKDKISGSLSRARKSSLSPDTYHSMRTERRGQSPENTGQSPENTKTTTSSSQTQDNNQTPNT